MRSRTSIVPGLRMSGPAPFDVNRPTGKMTAFGFLGRLPATARMPVLYLEEKYWRKTAGLPMARFASDPMLVPR